jgi:hypothetical protein
MNLNPNIEQAKKNHLAWWNRKGMVLNVKSPKRNAHPKDVVGVPTGVEARWTDLRVRCEGAEYDMAKTAYFADSLPLLCTTFGPGSLAEMLGAKPVYEPVTIWYEPCIADPDACKPIRFSPHNNASLDLHMRFIDEAMSRSGGRFMVAMSDLIENLDTLASLRGSEPLLTDLIERPQWIHQRQEEILQAFIEVFELFYQKTKDAQGGNAFIFDIWGPGRTCKVQCDFSCMISASMFREFVVPYLSRQCDFLDYSMYHLDGETALQHLDALLSIESLDAIEWTPMGAYGGSPVSHTGGHPQWYDLYRRIKAGGKSVQALGVKLEEVVPLLDAVGPEGMYVMTNAPDEEAAQKLVEQVQQYR